MLSDITFHLCDTNPELVEYWKEYFGDYPNFEIHHGDIIALTKSLVEKGNSNVLSCLTGPQVALVSPANSFGDMQGGVDLAYYTEFGHEVDHEMEESLQHHIIEKKHGELLVGQSISLCLQNGVVLIVAPTMRVPMNIQGTVNVYLAFRAVLLSLLGRSGWHVIVPGLGTGVGKILPELCAKQMHYAYHTVTNPNRHLDLIQMTKEHTNMISVYNPE